MDGALIVAEARRWRGTPYCHQHSLRGIGADCIGFVRGVMTACGLVPEGFERSPAALKYRGYPRKPDGRLQQAMREFLKPVDQTDMRVGDVLMMRFNYDPQHLGILANHPDGGFSMIHALNERGVVEHRLDAQWQNRIVEVYAVPGLDDRARKGCCPECVADGGCCS